MALETEVVTRQLTPPPAQKPCAKKMKKKQNVECNVIRKRLLNLHCYNSSGLLLECFGQFTVFFSSTTWWQPSDEEAMQEAQFLVYSVSSERRSGSAEVVALSSFL